MRVLTQPADQRRAVDARVAHPLADLWVWCLGRCAPASTVAAEVGAPAHADAVGLSPTPRFDGVPSM